MRWLLILLFLSACQSGVGSAPPHPVRLPDETFDCPRKKVRPAPPRIPRTLDQVVQWAAATAGVADENGRIADTCRGQLRRLKDDVVVLAPMPARPPRP